MVQRACSLQPPLSPSTHGSAGEQTYPSPEKPFRHVQFTFSPVWLHLAFLSQPPFQNWHISITGIKRMWVEMLDVGLMLDYLTVIFG